MQWFAYAFALVAGTLNALQSGSNATLNKALGQPVGAAVTVYVVGLLGVLASAPFLGLSWPGGERIAGAPWWAWIGGLLGAVYVLSIMYVADKVGAAVFTALTVTAAVVASTVLDHFGWMGFEQHAAGLGRIAGCLLMIAGLALLAVF